MPRKKPLHKYVTIRANGEWYVRKKVQGIKNPVWRLCLDRTPRGVQKILEDLEDAQLRSQREANAPVTLNSFFDYWLNEIEETIAGRTYEDYTEILRLRFRPAIGHVWLTELTTRHLETIFADLKLRSLSRRTRRYAYVVISACLNMAVKKGMIASNPARQLTVPKMIRQELHVMDKAQARDFFAACYDENNGLVLQFALETGMRPEEYLGLRWGDLDLDRCAASVQRALVHKRSNGGGWYFGPPKTSNSYRTVQFSALLRAQLNSHRDLQKRRLAELDIPRPEYDFVFPSEDFTPMRGGNLASRSYKRILAKAELPNHFNLYTLRHTCATLLLGHVSPKVVAERLGSSVAIVLKYYSHVLPGMQEAAADKIAGMLH